MDDFARWSRPRADQAVITESSMIPSSGAAGDPGFALVCPSPIAGYPWLTDSVLTRFPVGSSGESTVGSLGVECDLARRVEFKASQLPPAADTTASAAMAMIKAASSDDAHPNLAV